MTAADAGGLASEETRPDMIVCEGVSKWFGDFQALDGVTATIAEREVVVVLGPSGSGKSTWIRCINHLEHHQEGRIVVDGVELTNDLRNIEQIRSEVGMVFQQFNLFPHLTVLGNITLAPIWVRKKPRREAEEAARALLERVGIPEQADKYPGQLSGGQQQRVAIARALAMDPRVMLFDEQWPQVERRPVEQRIQPQAPQQGGANQRHHNGVAQQRHGARELPPQAAGPPAVRFPSQPPQRPPDQRRHQQRRAGVDKENVPPDEKPGSQQSAGHHRPADIADVGAEAMH